MSKHLERLHMDQDIQGARGNGVGPSGVGKRGLGAGERGQAEMTNFSARLRDLLADATPGKLVEEPGNFACVEGCGAIVFEVPCQGGNVHDLRLLIELCNHAEALADVVEAAKKLTAEAGGIAELSRECIGNTNVAAVQLRVAEVDAALAKLDGRNNG